MWNLHGIEPELLDYAKMEARSPGYQLRPEIMESAYILHHYTKDPKYIDQGRTFLQALVTQEAGRSGEEEWKLVTMNQASGMGERPHAAVVLLHQKNELRSEAQGDGPVDATFKAIEGLAKSGAELLLYSVNAVTTGTESQGEVTVRLAKGGRIVNGVGADTDIVVASAKAYISALNKLASKVERLNPQHQL